MSLDILKKSENFFSNDENLIIPIVNNRELFSEKINSTLNNQDVNYSESLNDNWNITWWKNTYVISWINSKNKFSEWYYDCTWIICSWISKETNTKISFLTHQDPLKILYNYNKEFIDWITMRINHMFEKTYSNTLDIWLFWWNITDRNITFSDYNEMIKIVRNIVNNTLNKELKILIWPNNIKEWFDNTIEETCSHFYFDNNNSFLYWYKPLQKSPITNISFLASDLYDVLW